MYRGRGIINSFINKLPYELHIPGYRFCGPGTKLEKRLARGDVGINPLDEACKEHDIAYNRFKDIENRRQADSILAEKAWQRVKASDSSVGEKTAAWMVTNAMKGKGKIGAGIKKKSSKRKTKRKQKDMRFMGRLRNWFTPTRSNRFTPTPGSRRSPAFIPFQTPLDNGRRNGNLRTKTG